jgi:PleD family two-component response regulator
MTHLPAYPEVKIEIGEASMNAEVIKAIAELTWPLLAMVALAAFIPPIRRIVQSRAFTIKYGDMELSVQDASDQLRKQIEDLQNQVRSIQEGRAPAAARRIGPEVSPAAPAAPRTILWVDDKPRNNAHEIKKLQDDGWEISTAQSTNQALAFLNNRSTLPSVVVSDMARREGLTYHPSAGLDLIREIRARKIDVPVFIYTSSDVDRYRDRVIKLGGNGITASPIDLFALVESTA